MAKTFHRYRVTCIDEDLDFFYAIEEGRDAPPTECPNNAGHTVDITITESTSEESQKDSENALVTRMKKSSWDKNFQKRFVSFTTSTLSSINDKNWSKADFGHCSLKFYDVNGDELESPTQETLNTDCCQTRLRIDLDYTCEIALARMHVPSSLDAPEADWLYSFVLAPDVANVDLSGLCPLADFKDKFIDIGSDVEVQKVEPNKLGGEDVPGGHIMDYIIYHPAGAKVKFMFEFEHYK